MLSILSFLATLHLGPAHFPTSLAVAPTVATQPPGRVKAKKKTEPAAPAPLPSTPTAGTVVSRSWDVCGGPTETSLLCASVEVSVSGTSTVFRVRNISGSIDFLHDGMATAGEWILTSVGIDGVPAAAGAFTTGSDATTGTWWSANGGSAAPASWRRFDDVQHGGGIDVDFGIDNGGGIHGGIASSCASPSALPGGSHSFWMTPVEGCLGAGSALPADGGWIETRVTTAGTWDPNGDGVSVFFKGQNGPGGASYACAVGAASRGDCSAIELGSGMAPGAVVPEPSTVVLTGSGLLALVVPAIRRRFRKP